MQPKHIRIHKLLLILILTLLYLLYPHTVRSDKAQANLPPPGYYKVGCTIEEVVTVKRKGKVDQVGAKGYSLKVWADYSSPREQWTEPTAPEPYRKRLDAMRACDQWLKRLAKVQLVSVSKPSGSK